MVAPIITKEYEDSLPCSCTKTTCLVHLSSLPVEVLTDSSDPGSVHHRLKKKPDWKCDIWCQVIEHSTFSESKTTLKTGEYYGFILLGVREALKKVTLVVIYY